MVALLWRPIAKNSNSEPEKKENKIIFTNILHFSFSYSVRNPRFLNPDPDPLTQLNMDPVQNRIYNTSQYPLFFSIIFYQW